MTMADLLGVDVEDLGSLGAGDFHETARIHLARILTEGGKQHSVMAH